MGSDLMVARGRATVDGHTLFGLNATGNPSQFHGLHRCLGREFALGETVQTQTLAVPQVRRTWTTLGSQPPGCWGYGHGINEHYLAIGYIPLPATRLARPQGLLATDLVRLTLERAQTARQAVKTAADLIETYGLAAEARAADHAFVLADTQEAFLQETAGRHWVCQEIQQVRAASGQSMIRQDWDQISQGLAVEAITRQWWPDDGTKLDFASVANQEARARDFPPRRWGRATQLLVEQSPHIDAAFLRRILTDHYEGTPEEVHPLNESAFPEPLCRHASRSRPEATVASLVAELHSDSSRIPMIWCALGPPCSSIYFPIFLDGEVPASFTAPENELHHGTFCSCLRRLQEHCRKSPRRWNLARDDLSRLQSHLDLETAEFLADGAAMKQHGRMNELQRLASAFMQHNVERFEALVENLTAAPRARSAKRIPALEPAEIIL